MKELPKQDFQIGQKVFVIVRDGKYITISEGKINCIKLEKIGETANKIIYCMEDSGDCFFKTDVFKSLIEVIHKIKEIFPIENEDVETLIKEFWPKSVQLEPCPNCAQAVEGCEHCNGAGTVFKEKTKDKEDNNEEEKDYGAIAMLSTMYVDYTCVDKSCRNYGSCGAALLEPGEKSTGHPVNWKIVCQSYVRKEEGE